MVDSLLSHHYVGLIVSVAAYGVGCWIKSRTRSPLANPLLIGSILVALIVQYSPLSLAQYRNGGAIITLFIVPATVGLAMQINRQWPALRSNAIPVIGACIIGSITSVVSVWLLCRVFGIDKAVTASLLPKSVTTAISIDLSERSGGIPSLTVSAVILTGILSAILSPFFIKALQLKNRIGNGIAIGVSGHALGTAKALEIGETEGAFSGIALGLSGIATSIMYALWG